jgi:hypothetical protein
MNPNENLEPRRGISRSTWVLIGFLAMAAYFLFSEHRAHFISYLPFLLLAACPLMHLFHGQGGHGGHSTHRGDERSTRPAPGSQRNDQPPAGEQHRH